MKTAHVTGLKCVICGEIYPADNRYTCPRDGIEGILDVQYDYDAVAKTLTRDALGVRERSQWRYRELLPVDSTSALPHLQVGFTPVYSTPRLASALGLTRLFLKDDGRNPTSSFKDRASAVGVVKAREFGSGIIACASTGNAASSLAGFAAATGLESFIFVPEHAPEPKVTQLLIFGAHVLKVKGSYDDAYYLCMEACEKWGWYNRNCAINAYLVEGKKTAGLEIGEQMAGEMPDWVVFSVGDGCTLAGAWKGLVEMKKLGFIDRLPRMLGVQAEGAKPIVDAFVNESDLHPVTARTVADSIAVGRPRNWRKALGAVRDSHGSMVAVSDAEILHWMPLTPRLSGVFGEPAGVAAIAGLARAREAGLVRAHESALAVITGNGLKDVASARKAAGEALTVSPELEELAAALKREGLV
ncbi:MAG: threonine synthase [Acidobacteria bacterium]|nr:threonine synthase [Acidobacteriota bacterium]